MSASLGLLVSPRKERHIYILVISPTTKYLEIKIFYAKLFLFQYKMKQINKAIAFEYVICKERRKRLFIKSEVDEEFPSRSVNNLI